MALVAFGESPESSVQGLLPTFTFDDAAARVNWAKESWTETSSKKDKATK
jgi:hypothetical protein